MTYVVEKFYDEYCIKKDDVILAVIDTGTNARKICKVLNSQEEQQQLLIHQIVDITQQKHNLMRYLEGCGFRMKEIETIMAYGDQL